MPPDSGAMQVFTCNDPSGDPPPVSLNISDPTVAFSQMVQSWCQNPGDATMLDTMNGTRKVWLIDYTYNSTGDPKYIVELVAATNENCTDQNLSSGVCSGSFVEIAEQCKSSVWTAGNELTVGGCVYDGKCFGYCMELYELVAGGAPPIYTPPPLVTTASFSTTHTPCYSSSCSVSTTTTAVSPTTTIDLTGIFLKVWWTRQCEKVVPTPKDPTKRYNCFNNWILIANTAAGGLDEMYTCPWLVQNSDSFFTEAAPSSHDGVQGFDGDGYVPDPPYPSPINPKTCPLGPHGDDPSKESLRFPQNCQDGYSIGVVPGLTGGIIGSLNPGPLGMSRCVVSSEQSDPIKWENFGIITVQCDQIQLCCIGEDTLEAYDNEFDCLDEFAKEGYNVQGPNHPWNEWSFHPWFKCHEGYCPS